MHHILEDKSFINDFNPEPAFVAISTPINLIKTPLPHKENVDTPEELQYVAEMKEVRQGIVKTVPAYQKRDEELSLRNAAKKAEVQGDEGGESNCSWLAHCAIGQIANGLAVLAPTNKRRKLGKGQGRSYAAVSRDQALATHIPGVPRLSRLAGGTERHG